MVRHLLFKLSIVAISFYSFNSFADLNTGLVRYMKFEEGSGTYTCDSSGDGGHYWISLPESTWTNDGFNGNGLNFKGWWGSNPNYNCIKVVDSTLPHVDILTASAWIYIDSLPLGTMSIASKGNENHNDGTGDEWGLYVYRPNQTLNYAYLGGYVKVACNDVRHGVQGGEVYPGIWTFVCIRYDGDSLKTFVNGVQVAANGQWLTDRKIASCGGFGRIGWWTLSDPTYLRALRGTIDELRIYNRALSENEIMELYCTNRIYVDSTATGNNNGTTWANAYTDLKMALDSAPAQTIICVSKGTYFPTCTTNRTISFQLKSKTCLYGGFNTSTGDTTISTRDWENNPTILSGDIGTRGDSTDDSYHVVKGANDAVIDGFIIERGNSNSTTYEHMLGGGMANLSVSPYILNCTFQNNHAIHAGAMYNRTGASPVIKNCMFLNNSVVWYGAGVYNLDNCAPYILNCRFVENHNDSVSSGNTRNGGALYILDTCNVTLVNCEFIKNNMRGYGGGIFIQRNSHVCLYNCSFYRNIGMWYERGGGAISVYGDSCTVTINNCILWKDSSVYSGEIYLRPNTGCNATIKNSNIEGGWNGSKVYTSENVQNLGGNINSKPLFNNPDSLDLSLNPGSPCIDTGDNSLVQTEKDINGDTRITDGNSDQTATIDMGSYEYQP